MSRVPKMRVAAARAGDVTRCWSELRVPGHRRSTDAPSRGCARSGSAGLRRPAGDRPIVHRIDQYSDVAATSCRRDSCASQIRHSVIGRTGNRRCSRWCSHRRRQRLSGSSSRRGRPVRVPLAQVLTAATLLLGLHRRVFGQAMQCNVRAGHYLLGGAAYRDRHHFDVELVMHKVEREVGVPIFLVAPPAEPASPGGCIPCLPLYPRRARPSCQCCGDARRTTPVSMIRLTLPGRIIEVSSGHDA